MFQLQVYFCHLELSVCSPAWCCFKLKEVPLPKLTLFGLLFKQKYASWFYFNFLTCNRVHQPA